MVPFSFKSELSYSRVMKIMKQLMVESLELRVKTGGSRATGAKAAKEGSSRGHGSMLSIIDRHAGSTFGVRRHVAAFPRRDMSRRSKAQSCLRTPQPFLTGAAPPSDSQLKTLNHLLTKITKRTQFKKPHHAPSPPTAKDNLMRFINTIYLTYCEEKKPFAASEIGL
jgi:hypothetical protein